MREVWAQEQLRVYVQHEARQHRMEQTQYMDVVLCCFLSRNSIQNDYPGRAVITSLVSVRSVCAVGRSVVRCMLRRAVCLTLCRQGVKHQPKEKLGLDSVRAQQTFVAKVTVCRHVVSQQTFDSGLDHRSVFIIHRGITQTSCMLFTHSYGKAKERY